MAAWPALCVVALLFGPLCILFPDILGGMQGPAGRGAWLNPTPSSIVSILGWSMMAVPLLVWICLS